MSKYSLTTLLLIFFSINSLAQDSLKLTSNPAPGITSPAAPVITVKAEDIRRFPSANFLEALEGFFPWVHGPGQSTDNFLFIVNGVLLADVNSISLHDVEEISFTRDNLYGGLLPLAKAGTFFITLKKADNRLQVNFNSQFNFIDNRDKPFYKYDAGFRPPVTVLTNDINNGTGNYFLNHLSVSQAGNKYDWHAGIYYNGQKTPGLQQKAVIKNVLGTIQDTVSPTVKGRLKEYGVLGTFNYQLLSSLKAGVMINYAGKNYNGDTGIIRTSDIFYSYTNETSRIDFRTFTASVYLQWQPFTRLSNRLSANYVHFKQDAEENGEQVYLSQAIDTRYLTVGYDRAKTKGLLISNHLAYTIVKNDRINAGIDITANWFKQDFKNEDRFVVTYLTTPPVPASVSGSAVQYNRKDITVNPAFHFSYKNSISAYAGAGYQFGSIKIGDIKFSDRVNPYAGIDLDLKNIFTAGKAIDVLHLSFNYAKLARSSYVLPEIKLGNQPPSPPVFSGSFVPSTNLSDKIEDQMIAVKLTAGLLQSKLLFTAEWSKLTYDKIFFYQPTGSQSLYAVMDKETAQGFSIHTSAKLINRKKLQLSTRLSVLLPKIMSATEYPGALNYINDVAMRSGLQNRLTFKNYFLQVNALMYFNQAYAVTVEGASRANYFVINNLLAGLNMNNTKGILKNSTLFVQVRNLYVSNELKEQHIYNRFMGAGVNIAF